MGRLKKLISATGGSEITEAALVIPIFFMILLGIYWFGRALNTYATLNHAAREGALVATMYTCASCVPPNHQNSASNVATAVTTALQAAGLDPNQIQLYPPPSAVACGGGTLSCSTAGNNNTITICSNVQLPNKSFAGSGAPACGVTVSFQYPYNFSLPFPVPPYGANAFNLQLKAEVQMKGEY